MKKYILKILIIGALVILLLIVRQSLILSGINFICISGKFPDLRVGPCPQKAPTVTPYPLPTAASKSPIPIIFDDDGSADGLIALLYFLRNPLYDVRAVTVSQGEAHPQLFAQHMTQFLAGLGRNDIPVGIGRETPLEGDNAFPEPWRNASDRFYEIPLSDSHSVTEPRPAAELIIETLTQSTEPVVVFISGPHTNLAEALRIDPQIREKISAIYVMGGSIYKPGNIESDWPEINNAVAEWNIWVDPLAAGEVFASGVPLHLVPLDATNQIVWKEADAQTWASSVIPETKMAGDILDWMLRSWSTDSAYIWDLVTAVVATDSRLCPAVPLAMDVIVDPGPTQGQTVITNGTANALVCLEPDADQIRARVEEIFGK